MFESGISAYICWTWPHFFYCITIWHPIGTPNNQMIVIYTHVALLFPLRCSLTFARETEYIKRSVCSCWGHDSVHADAAPSPVLATFIEPRLICQSTFLLLRDRRTGRLSDCLSAVITFSTTCCSAAPQTPGKLPRPLTFPLEKIHMEMAVTGWHSTFCIWWGKAAEIPCASPSTTVEVLASVMWIDDDTHKHICGGLPRADPLWA